MSGNLWLDWATLAVSLANVILMLWLGLVVWLNTGQRSRGVWLASSGLLLGALFFVSHTALLGSQPVGASSALNGWWSGGWLLLILLPLNWYLVLAWYAGFWPEDKRLPQPRPWAAVLVGLALGLAGWLLVGRPLPPFDQVVRLDLTAAPLLSGLPLFLLIFPAYILLCTSLALSLLFRPSADAYIRADGRRARARPWLLGISAGLVGVSLLVTAAIGWAWLAAAQPLPFLPYDHLVRIAAGLDLLIAGLITGVVILLGQAIVLFEVFTEQPLPSGEFQRQWRNVIILAAGFSAVVAAGLVWPVRPVVALLLAVGIMTVYLALSRWRGYAWRAHYLRQLRPMLASQHLYDQLLTTSPAEFDAAAPFALLCRELLQAETACLMPLGSLAPLIQPLVYPANGSQPASLSPELLQALRSPAQTAIPLEAGRLAGMSWAIALWSERGLIGALLLGPRQDGGLYTQEQMEIARAGGERLVDTWASVALGRRLLALQRQRLVESQLLDRQTRRVLHDEVLPELHTLLLTCAAGPDGSDAAQSLAALHRRISDLLRDMPPAGEGGLGDAAGVGLARLGLLAALRRLLATDLAGAFDQVEWDITPAAAAATQRLPPLTGRVLFYAARELLRNAAKHGRGAQHDRSLSLRIMMSHQAGLTLAVEDDGVGLTGRRSDSGQGLALHSTMLAVIGAELTLDSEPGRYTRATITYRGLEN